MHIDSTITPARRARGSAISRRAEILAAAKRLFLADGYERATIRKIAASVGVSSAALYLYFPDKDAILRGIAEETFTALLVRLEAARHGPGDALTRMRASMHAYIAFGCAHPDEYRLTFLSKMMSVSSPGRYAEACGDIEAADRSFGLLVQDTRALIEAGLFRPIDPVEAAEALWACTHGATAMLIDHSEHLTTDSGRLADRVVDIALRGLCATQNDH
jgi:AcrR family transcriptional regulator